MLFLASLSANQSAAVIKAGFAKGKGHDQVPSAAALLAICRWAGLWNRIPWGDHVCRLYRRRILTRSDDD
jgi:hypothetical protein